MAYQVKRLLRTGDFLPDLEGCNARGQTLHSAALAGHAVALWLCADVQALHAHSLIMAAHNALWRDLLPTAALVFEVAPDDLIDTADLPCFALATNTARPMFFPAAAGRAPKLCLVRHDGKIAWIGGIEAIPSQNEVLIVTVQQLIADTASAGVPPILLVKQALSATLCAGLIETYRASERKIQGRVGLSSPRFDPSRKRVSHVNLDRATAMAVDAELVYSLLPMIERCFDFQVSRRVAYKIGLYDAADAGFFHAHRDNSDSGTRYRRYAMSLSLNDDWHGGGLCFPEFGPTKHRIGAGNALIFPVSLMHKVAPVEFGQRYMLLSFFYDEIGARDRRAELANPALLDGIYNDAINPGLLAEYHEYYAPDSRFSAQYKLDDPEPAFIGIWRAQASR